MEIHKRIIEVRKHSGLNQADFAKKLNLTQSLISRLESGKTPIIEQNIKLISLTFGVREEWLRSGEGEMENNEALLSDYEKRLLGLFGALSPRARKMLIEYAEKLGADEAALRGEVEDEKGEPNTGRNIEVG